MKTALLILFITTATFSFSQNLRKNLKKDKINWEVKKDNYKRDSIIKYRLKNEIELSKLSFSIIPFINFYHGYNDNKVKSDIDGGTGLGWGLELELNHLNKKRFSVGGFGRYSNINNGPDFSGSSGSLHEPWIERYFAIGGLTEYRPIKDIGIRVKIGYETRHRANHYYNSTGGLIVGAGLKLYIEKTEKVNTTTHSINLLFYHNSNHSKPYWGRNERGSTVQNTYFFDSINFQLGWNIEIHKNVKKK